MQEYEQLVSELKQKVKEITDGNIELRKKITRTIEEYESKLEEQQKEYKHEKQAKEWAQQEYARAQNQLEKTDYELQNTLNAQKNTKQAIEAYVNENNALRTALRVLVKAYV